MKEWNSLQRKERISFEKRLGSLLKSPLSLTVTDNTHSMISVRKKPMEYSVCLHHMFLDADESLLQSLVRYISGRNSEVVIRELRAFIRTNAARIKKKDQGLIFSGRRPPRIRTAGSFSNLQETFDRLNRKYFENALHCAITWGNRRRRSGGKSIRFGSYSPGSETIRINPILDQASVPAYILDYIVFHEMLHYRLGCRKRNGRQYYHDALFRQMERQFTPRDRAKLWLKKNILLLLKP